MRFKTHYTREQARQLLPKVRVWLERLAELRTGLGKLDTRLDGLMAPGRDLGGGLVNSWVSALAEIQTLLFEFYKREIQIKDVDRGLVDFPSVIAGKEVYLCWEKGEDDIEFWHDLDAGYAGRERL